MIATSDWLLVRKSGEWKIHGTIHVLLHDDDVQIDSRVGVVPWLAAAARVALGSTSSSIGRHYRRHLMRFSLKALSALPPSQTKFQKPAKNKF